MMNREITELYKQELQGHLTGENNPLSDALNDAVATRQVPQLAEKRRIARLVAYHIPNHTSLFIHLGTTVEEVARALCHHQDLRVITTSLNVAAILSQNTGFEVIITGGVVRATDRAITGDAIIDFIGQFKVDFGVIGASSIEDDGTLLGLDYQEARIAEAIIANSRRVLLAADHTKFGRNALVRIGHLSQINALFTDQPLPEHMSGVFAEAKAAAYFAGP